MRTILLSILAVLLIAAPNAAAHTYLDTTNPADGAVVVEPLQSIELTYAGKIEVGSMFKVIASNGVEFETASMELVDGVLTGTFASPLPNDEYTVEWNSISEDGHPLSGQFSFTVDAPVTEDVIEEAVEENEEQLVEETVQNEVTENAVADKEETSNMPLYIVGATLLLLVLVIIGAMAKRKNTK